MTIFKIYKPEKEPIIQFELEEYENSIFLNAIFDEARIKNWIICINKYTGALHVVNKEVLERFNIKFYQQGE